MRENDCITPKLFQMEQDQRCETKFLAQVTHTFLKAVSKN